MGFQEKNCTLLTKPRQLFGLLEDMHMTPTQFNLALMSFFFTYGLCEPLANIALRRLGPQVWFPIIVIAWGLVTTLTSLCTSYGAYVAIRLALGVAEAGLYPGAYFVLSMWYTPRELATRMAVFYGANTAAGAFGGVIAYGVGSSRLDGARGWRAWRWLFVLEGAITMLAGVACRVALPPFPHQDRHRHRDKTATCTWLTADERAYAQLRVAYASGPDAPSYTFRWADVRAAARDRKTYLLMMLFWWGGSVPTYALSYTLPTMVAQLGYSAVQAQAMSTPPYLVATAVCVAVAWLSDRFQARYVALMGCYVLGLAGLLALWLNTTTGASAGARYVALCVAASGFAAQAPLVGAWTSVNVPNPSKRAAAMGLLMLGGSIGGGSIGSTIFLAREAPTYPLGFGVSVGATVLGAMVPATIHWWLLRRENARRARLCVDEVESMYTRAQLADMGEDSPLFRFTT